ncbi:MAG: PDGLE domain-containing protein [Chloroflexi bacterium]|nr:PDGLE domain-containing protein [Chloroflexota bacterium]
MKLKWWHYGLLLAILVSLFSPLASSWPDGLERVAEEIGFGGATRAPLFQLIPAYAFPGVANPAIATILAGLLGTIILFVLTYALGLLLRRREVD